MRWNYSWCSGLTNGADMEIARGMILLLFGCDLLWNSANERGAAWGLMATVLALPPYGLIVGRPFPPPFTGLITLRWKSRGT